MIQDADHEHQPFGTFEKKISYLNEQKQALQLAFETFLFPNHQENGDLETLLLQIVKPEKFEPFRDCYRNYVHCIKEYSPISEQAVEELMRLKNQIFGFILSYQGRDFAHEHKRNYQSELWDLGR